MELLTAHAQECLPIQHSWLGGVVEAQSSACGTMYFGFFPVALMTMPGCIVAPAVAAT